MSSALVRQPLSELERLLAENAAEIKADAPDQWVRIQRVVQALKKVPATAKGLSPEVQRDLNELYRWQLQAQRRDTLARLEELKPQVASGEALAKKADEALRRVVEVLDLALRGAEAPSAQAQNNLERVAAQARQALEGVEAAFAKRLAEASLRPVQGGAIVSSSGVALKAVTSGKPAPPVNAPAPVKPAAALSAFRLLPGVSQSPGSVRPSAPAPSAPPSGARPSAPRPSAPAPGGAPKKGR